MIDHDSEDFNFIPIVDIGLNGYCNGEEGLTKCNSCKYRKSLISINNLPIGLKNYILTHIPEFKVEECKVGL